MNLAIVATIIDVTQASPLLQLCLRYCRCHPRLRYPRPCPPLPYPLGLLLIET